MTGTLYCFKVKSVRDDQYLVLGDAPTKCVATQPVGVVPVMVLNRDLHTRATGGFAEMIH